MRRVWLHTMLIGLWLLVGAAQAQDRQAWLEDYAALKRFLENHYANLDWARSFKRLNLPQLDANTRKALAAAQSNAQAQHAMEQFLAAFGDAHLGLRPPFEAANASNEPPLILRVNDSANDVCKALGFRVRGRGFSLPFEQVAGFAVSGNDQLFAAGIMPTSNGKRYGVLRIPLFAPSGYWANCTAAWHEYRVTLKQDCDEACQQAFQLFAANRLSAELAQQVAALRAQQIDGLIVDIGGNGGGSEWADIAARILSAKPLHAPRQASVRHPRNVAMLERKLRALAEDLQRDGLSAPQRQVIQQTRQQLQKALADEPTRCDKAGLWTNHDKPCANLNAMRFFSTGLLAHAAPGSLDGLRSKTVLFQPSRYTYREGAFDGALFVIVDDKTASAAEQFAALLQDNQAARIVGERTLGVGCGYTNGGLILPLPHSRLRVVLPDCLRYRKDGGNEAAGVQPDFVTWSKDEGKAARLQKLLKALP